MLDLTTLSPVGAVVGWEARGEEQGEQSHLFLEQFVTPDRWRLGLRALQDATQPQVVEVVVVMVARCRRWAQPSAPLHPPPAPGPPARRTRRPPTSPC